MFVNSLNKKLLKEGMICVNIKHSLLVKGIRVKIVELDLRDERVVFTTNGVSSHTFSINFTGSNTTEYRFRSAYKNEIKNFKD